MSGLEADGKRRGGMPKPAAATVKLPPLARGRYIRNTIARLRDTLGLFTALRRGYGDIVRYRILFLEFCIVFDPEMIREVVDEQRSSFEKGFIYKRNTVLHGPTIVTGDGQDHKRRRRIVDGVDAFLDRPRQQAGSLARRHLLKAAHEFISRRIADAQMLQILIDGAAVPLPRRRDPLGREGRKRRCPPRTDPLRVVARLREHGIQSMQWAMQWAGADCSLTLMCAVYHTASGATADRFSAAPPRRCRKKRPIPRERSTIPPKICGSCRRRSRADNT